MSTYTMSGLIGFIEYVYKEQSEDQLWEVWLHKPVEKNFKEWKKDQMKKVEKTKIKELTTEQEKQIIEYSMNFVKPRKRGGE